MTAVAAIWHFDRDRDARDSCARMLSALQPYGIHHKGMWAEGAIALGRTLYRTLPEDRYDRQPLQVADGSAVLVADLRLDNRSELIADLGLGGSAATMADSDILARAWEAWGEACVPRLIGDFAFIVWDARRDLLFGARDPLGRRPLFYHHARGFAAVSSMPKGLLALPEIPRADPVGVAVAPDAVLAFHDGDTVTVLPELSAPPTAPGAPKPPSQNPTP